MRTTPSPKLQERLKDDPFYTPGMSLDVSGLPTEYHPVAVQEDDPFAQKPEPKMLTLAERQRIAEHDPETVAEAVSDLATANHWSPDEKQAVLSKFHPQPKRTFYVGSDWTCSAEYLPGSGWQVRAEHDDGVTQAFKVPGIARHDFDSVVERSISFLAAISHSRKPYKDLTRPQLDDCGRMASRGDLGSILTAAEMFVAYALSDYSDSDDFNLIDCRGDERYIELWDSACWFAVKQGVPGLTPEAEAYMSDLLADKAITINSLLGAYDEWKSDRMASKSRLFNSAPEPEPEVNLDALSDDEIEAQLRATRLYAARGNR